MSKKKRHSFVAFYPSDWRSGTSHLPRVMRSAYFDLCIHMWEFAKPVSRLDATMILFDLPNADEVVDQLVALGKLRRDEDGSVHNDKAIEEGQKAFESWERQSQKGEAGAAKRWGKKPSPPKGKNACAITGAMENEERRTKSPSSKDKKERAVGAGLPDWLPLPEWDAYLEMRKKKRAVPTDHAIALLLADLEAMKAKGFDPVVVLNQSTKNNWTGIFEPKPDLNGGRPKTGVNRRTFDDIDYGEIGKL